MCISVCVCVSVVQGHPITLLKLSRYHLPNLYLTLINLRLCNPNLRRRFFVTSEACTVATDVAFPVRSALHHDVRVFFPTLSTTDFTADLFPCCLSLQQNNFTSMECKNDKCFNKLVIFFLLPLN